MHFKARGVSSSQINWLCTELKSRYYWKFCWDHLRCGNSWWQSVLKMWVLWRTGAVAYNQRVKYYLW